jgi:hypothetical protein
VQGHCQRQSPVSGAWRQALKSPAGISLSAVMAVTCRLAAEQRVKVKNFMSRIAPPATAISVKVWNVGRH